MRKGFLMLLISLFMSNVLFAQVFPLLPKYYQPLDSSALTNKDKNSSEQDLLLQNHEKVSYSVAVGGAYSSFGNNISMMTSYIAPSINYRVNSKLFVAVDGIIMQNNMSGMESKFGAGSQYTYNSSPQNYGISGSAYYQLSDKWSIYGDGAYFENQSVFNDFRSEMYNTDFKTVSLGVGYKLNEKVNFSIQYRYSNGLDPSYNFSSPFIRSQHDPFRSGSGIWGY